MGQFGWEGLSTRAWIFFKRAIFSVQMVRSLEVKLLESSRVVFGLGNSLHM